MSETEVTQSIWKMFMEYNPSFFVGENKPVENVKMKEITIFFQKLKTKGYGSFRLPSESEWEYACRAGTTTRYGFGDSDIDLDDYDWYKWNGNKGRMGTVATKKQNNWGLYDMHGNVGEWVEDYYNTDYRNAPNNGSAWTDLSPIAGYVVRGGGRYTAYTTLCHSTIRNCRTLDSDIYPEIGFRLAMDLPTAKPQDKKP